MLKVWVRFPSWIQYVRPILSVPGWLWLGYCLNRRNTRSLTYLVPDCCNAEIMSLSGRSTLSEASVKSPETARPVYNLCSPGWYTRIHLLSSWCCVMINHSLLCHSTFSISAPLVNDWVSCVVIGTCWKVCTSYSPSSVSHHGPGACVSL